MLQQLSGGKVSIDIHEGGCLISEDFGSGTDIRAGGVPFPLYPRIDADH